MPEQTLRFLLVVDALTGLVTKVSEIDDAGTVVQDLGRDHWICAAALDGTATTLVFTSKKDKEGMFPAGPIIDGR
jgi:hypothetical protein